MRNLLRAGVMALVLAPMCALAQTVTLPQVHNAGGASVPATGAVIVDSSGAEKGTSANPLVISGLVTASGGGAVTAADGAIVNIGYLADAAYTGTGSATLTALGKGQWAKLAAILAALGSPLQGGGMVSVSNFPASFGITGTVPVTGAFYQATQPVSLASASTSTSTALTATDSDTAVHAYGPFTPQLARDMWLTLVGTGASGTAQLLRSTDGGTTKLAITAGGTLWASYNFTGITGVIVNEQVLTASDAAATYYVAVALTAGSATVRLAQ